MVAHCRGDAAAERQSVGILDADITGPRYQVLAQRITGPRAVIWVYARTNAYRHRAVDQSARQVHDPVIWRGPLIGGTVKQFWTDVIWGELDTLVLDMPPGTGDVALTARRYRSAYSRDSPQISFR